MRTGRLHTLSCHPHSMFCSSAYSLPTCPFLSWHHTIWMLPRFRSSLYHLWFFFTLLIGFIGTTVCSLSMYHFLQMHFQLYVQMITLLISIMVGQNIRCCICTGLIHSCTNIHGGFNHATTVFPLIRSCGHDSLLRSDLVDLFILLACEVCSFIFAFDHGYGSASFEVLFFFFPMMLVFICHILY